MSTENENHEEMNLRNLLHQLIRDEFTDPLDQQNITRLIDVSFESVRDIDAILDEDLEATVLPSTNGEENHV